MGCPGPYSCAGCHQCAATQRRPLTRTEQQRLNRALADHPPVHGPRPLRIVQAEQGRTVYAAPVACDESMTCDCPRCQDQRFHLINTGIRRVRQPWERAA